MTYAIVIEPTETGFSAHVPDLPGCIAAADSLQELKELMAEAVQGHIAAMRRRGYDVPPATTMVDQVEYVAQ